MFPQEICRQSFMKPWCISASTTTCLPTAPDHRSSQNPPSTISKVTILTKLDELNANVTGLPTLANYSLNTQSYIGPNAITNLTSFRVDAGPSYLFVEGITLQQNGLIYFIIGDPTTWTRAPLVSEIKKGSGPNGLPPIHFRILSYRTADTTSAYMAWTDMP
jgi:hypothetical protein